MLTVPVGSLFTNHGLKGQDRGSDSLTGAALFCVHSLKSNRNTHTAYTPFRRPVVTPFAARIAAQLGYSTVPPQRGFLLRQRLVGLQQTKERQYNETDLVTANRGMLHGWLDARRHRHRATEFR